MITLLSCLLLSIHSCCAGEEPSESRSGNFQNRQIWKTWPKNNKAETESNICLCYPRANAPVLPIDNNQNLKRLVVYYYYTDKSSPTFVYVPNKLKQLSIPSVYEDGDKIEPLSDTKLCNIPDLYRDDGVTPINTAQYSPRPEVHPTDSSQSQLIPDIKYYEIPNLDHGFPQIPITYKPGQSINGIVQYEISSTQKVPTPIENLPKVHSSEEGTDKEKPHSELPEPITHWKHEVYPWTTQYNSTSASGPNQPTTHEPSEENRPKMTNIKIIHRNRIQPPHIINNIIPQPWQPEHVLSSIANQHALSEILPIKNSSSDVSNLRPESFSVPLLNIKQQAWALQETLPAQKIPKQPTGLIWGPESIAIAEKPTANIKTHSYPINNILNPTKKPESEMYIVPSTLNPKNKWTIHRPSDTSMRPTSWEIPEQSNDFKPNRIIKPQGWVIPGRKIPKGKLTIYDYLQQHDIVTPESWKVPEKSSYISQIPIWPNELNLWKQPESFNWTTVHTRPIGQNIIKESWKIPEKTPELPDVKQYPKSYEVHWPTQIPISESWMVQRPSQKINTLYNVPIRPEYINSSPESWVISETSTNNPEDSSYPIRLTPTEVTQNTSPESWIIPGNLMPTNQLANYDIPITTNHGTDSWEIYESPNGIPETNKYTINPVPMQVTSTMKPESWVIPESSIAKSKPHNIPVGEIVKLNSWKITERPESEIQQATIPNTKPESWMLHEMTTSKLTPYKIPTRPNDINLGFEPWEVTAKPSEVPESQEYPIFHDMPTHTSESFMIPETTTLMNEITPNVVYIRPVTDEPQSRPIQEKPSNQPEILEYPIHIEQTSEPTVRPIYDEYPIYETLHSQQVKPMPSYDFPAKYHRPNTWFSPDLNWEQIQPEASQMLVRPTSSSVQQNIRPSEYVWSSGDRKINNPQSHNQAYTKWIKILKPSTMTIQKQKELPYLLAPDRIKWNKIPASHANGSQWSSIFQYPETWDHMKPNSIKEPANGDSSSEENSAFLINGIGYQANTGLVSSKSIYLSKQRPVNLSHQNSKYVITFDEWLQQQMKRLLGEGKSANLNAHTVKSLIEKTLSDNGMYLTRNGFIVNSKGKMIDMSNLKLRPILIGSSVEYAKLMDQSTDRRKFKLPEDQPYLKAVLVSLVNPPKILGIIALGRTYPQKSGAKGVKPAQTGSASYIPSMLSYGNKIPTKNEHLYTPDARHWYKNRPSNKKMPQDIFPTTLDDLTAEYISNEDSNEQQEKDYTEEQVPGENNPFDWNDAYPGFRIIGGHAATSSGYPLSNKGRHGQDN